MTNPKPHEPTNHPRALVLDPIKSKVQPLISQKQITMRYARKLFTMQRSSKKSCHKSTGLYHYDFKVKVHIKRKPGTRALQQVST
jgi:hypothetical protein